MAGLLKFAKGMKNISKAADDAAKLKAKNKKLSLNIARDKAIKKKGNAKLLSTQTGAGRGKFERGNPPAPKPVEGMAMGTKGGSAKDEAAVEAGAMGKVTMSADPSFINNQATRATKKAATNRVNIFKLAEDGDKKAISIKNKIQDAEKKMETKRVVSGAQSRTLTKKYDKGTYINRDTGEVIKDPVRAKDFPDGGPSIYDYNPTANRMESIKNNVAAKERTNRDRELEGMKAKQLKSKIKLSSPPSKNTDNVGKGGTRFNMGGMANKKRIGINDYRKGGYVLSSVDNRKGKK
jgi:hypothetical protein